MNIIFGIYDKLTPESVGPIKAFIQTLRSYYDGKIVIFSSLIDQDVCDFFQKYNIELIPKKTYDDKYNIHPSIIYATKRFVYYYYYLQQHPYSNILMIDTTDSLIQGNPFEIMSIYPNYSTIVSQEYKTIDECPYNSTWSKDFYSKEYDYYKNTPIICSGVIYTKFESNFYKILFKEINRAHEIGIFQQVIDQAYVNNITRLQKTDSTILPHYNPYFMHLGYTPKNEVTTEKNEIFINNIKPIIVHQYNRHYNLQWIDNTFQLNK